MSARFFLTLALVSLVLAGCGGSRPTSGEPAPPSETRPSASDTGAPFPLLIGESATLNANGDQIRFNRVVSDNRCPQGAACVQAGTALVQVGFTADDVTTAYTLEIQGNVNANSRPGAHRWLEARGMRFTLLALDPYPNLDAPAPAGTTPTVTLKVEPLSRVRPGG